MYAIVMAGGAGTRLWPLSRRRTPKQLLALAGDASLLQQTVARLAPLLAPEDIFVITSQAHVRATREQLPQLPADNVLGEPLARNTGVAAALATRSPVVSPTRSRSCCRPTTSSPTRPAFVARCARRRASPSAATW